MCGFAPGQVRGRELLHENMPPSPWVGDSRVCTRPLRWGPHPHSRPEAPGTASPVNQSVRVYSGGAHAKMALRRAGFMRRGAVTGPRPDPGRERCPAAGSPFWTHEVTAAGWL